MVCLIRGALCDRGSYGALCWKHAMAHLCQLLLMRVWVLHSLGQVMNMAAVNTCVRLLEALSDSCLRCMFRSQSSSRMYVWQILHGVLWLWKKLGDIKRFVFSWCLWVWPGAFSFATLLLGSHSLFCNSSDLAGLKGWEKVPEPPSSCQGELCAQGCRCLLPPAG